MVKTLDLFYTLSISNNTQGPAGLTKLPESVGFHSSLFIVSMLLSWRSCTVVCLVCHLPKQDTSSVWVDYKPANLSSQVQCCPSCCPSHRSHDVIANCGSRISPLLIESQASLSHLEEGINITGLLNLFTEEEFVRFFCLKYGDQWPDPMISYLCNIRVWKSLVSYRYFSVI